MYSKLDGAKDDHSASLSLASHHNQSSRGYYYDLNEIKKSFIVLYYQYVLLFERYDSKWLITVLSQKKETNYILITYWLPKVSEKFDIHSTIKIQPFDALEQPDTNKCLEIPKMPSTWNLK
jgi:hypothetical protein